MADDQKVQYVIELLEKGDGAKQAVSDLKAVGAAAKETAAATEVMNKAGAASAAGWNVSAGQMKHASHALAADLRLLALVSFPEVAAKGLAAEAALKATASTAKLLGVSATSVGGVVVALAASVWTGVEAWKAYKAILQEADSELALMNRNAELAKSLVHTIETLKESGKISPDKYGQLRGEVRGALTAATTAQESEFLRRIALELADLNAESKQYLELKKQLIAASEIGYAKAISEAQAVNELNAERIKDTKSLTIAQREELNALNAKDLVLAKNRAEFQRTADIEHITFEVRKDSLSAEDRKLGEINLQYNQLFQKVADLGDSGAISYEKVLALQDQLGASLHRAKFEASDLGQAVNQSVSMLASTGAHAFVGLITGAKDLKQQFADLLKSIAEMILQMILLRTLKSAFGLAGDGGVFPSARGGVYAMAAGGIAGVDTVSSPTFFPQFNVLAGERGSEMLAVLSRPQMMEVGGVRAAIGYAQGNQLALSSAADLKRAAAGKEPVEILISLDPGLHAQIVSDATHSAVIRINTNLKQDTDTSRAVKSLMT